MRKTTLALILSASALAACTSLTPAQKTALTFACQVDGVVQPMAVPVVAATGASGAAAAATDVLIVHPAVVTACAQLGGVPVVVPAPVAAPVASVVAAPVAAK